MSFTTVEEVAEETGLSNARIREFCNNKILTLNKELSGRRKFWIEKDEKYRDIKEYYRLQTKIFAKTA